MPNVRRACALARAAALTVLSALPLAGQQTVLETGRITGVVVDAESGRGVPGVGVRILPPDGALAITNDEGRFLFDRVRAGLQELEISHIGYGRHSELVNVPAGRTVELRIEVAPEAVVLGGIRVQVTLRNRDLEERGFYDRQRFGFGRFFDREALEGRSLVSALREVPRLRMVSQRGSGFNHVPVFSRGTRSCVPIVWIDRRPVRLRGWAIEDMLHESDIAALEVYRPGDTPGEFQAIGTDCGAIVAWTRGMNPG